MNRFTPTTTTISGSDELSPLEAAVLDSLTRPIYRPLSWGPLRISASAWLGAGLLPIVLLLRWFRQFTAVQEQQLAHVAEWTALQVNRGEAQRLHDSAAEARFSSALGALTAALAIGAGLTIAQHFTHYFFSYGALLDFTNRLPITPAQWQFTALLSAAAGCHWIHLLLHQLRVERFVREFNALTPQLGTTELSLPYLEMGLGLFWVIGALMLAGAFGTLWAIPVLLAAGAQRRYVVVGSVRTRALLAEKIRAVLLARRPRMRVPSPIQIVRTCVRPDCRAPLPIPASFCPRCGTRAIRRMEFVA